MRYLINSIKILISIVWSSFPELICEPSHFKRINHQSELEKHLGSCSAVANVEDIYFPAFNPKSKQCILQQQHMLFSCVGEHPDFSRLCPCRSYMEGQTALCTTCLWRQWWWYDVIVTVGNWCQKHRCNFLPAFLQTKSCASIVKEEKSYMSLYDSNKRWPHFKSHKLWHTKNEHERCKNCLTDTGPVIQATCLTLYLGGNWPKFRYI